MICRRKSPPTGGHFRRQMKCDPCRCFFCCRGAAEAQARVKTSAPMHSMPVLAAPSLLSFMRLITNFRFLFISLILHTTLKAAPACL